MQNFNMPHPIFHQIFAFQEVCPEKSTDMQTGEMLQAIQLQRWDSLVSSYHQSRNLVDPYNSTFSSENSWF